MPKGQDLSLFGLLIVCTKRVLIQIVRAVLIIGHLKGLFNVRPKTLEDQIVDYI